MKATARRRLHKSERSQGRSHPVALIQSLSYSRSHTVALISVALVLSLLPASCFSSAAATTPVWTLFLTASGRARRRSSARIVRQLPLPVSTVVVTQRRVGLARLRGLEPKRVVIRYERARPGGLVHFDVKKRKEARVDRRPGGPSHSRRPARAGAGRAAGTTCTWRSTMRRAAGLMTDNGNGFRSHAFRRMRLLLGSRPRGLFGIPQRRAPAHGARRSPPGAAPPRDPGVNNLFINDS